MRYNWQQEDWPCFRYSLAGMEALLLKFAEQAGQAKGMLAGMDPRSQWEAAVEVMLAEALNTSEIEGEYLRRSDVMSSIRNQLGLSVPPEATQDAPSAGAGELMVKVRREWDEPLSEQTLFQWHRLLFPQAGGIQAGGWRTHTEPMQVVSGRIGRPNIHFEAPPSEQVPPEMKRFLNWFNESRNTVPHAPIRAGLAHLYFESIHPFEDGNGRIGRAIAEKALSQGLQRPAFLSLSQIIEAQKADYYAALEAAQRSNEVTPWLQYFCGTVQAAQEQALVLIRFTVQKARFFDLHRHHFNDRQQRILQKMFEAGPEGFKGGMNARKYVSITQTSKATATRDLQHLVELGAFEPIGQGRSARYALKLPSLELAL